MKLSTALLKFAEPLWVPGSPPLSTEEFERALSLATLVWNVAVMEGVLGRRGRGRAELLRALMPGEQASEIEALLQRKKSCSAVIIASSRAPRSHSATENGMSRRRG